MEQWTIITFSLYAGSSRVRTQERGAASHPLCFGERELAEQILSGEHLAPSIARCLLVFAFANRIARACFRVCLGSLSRLLVRSRCSTIYTDGPAQQFSERIRCLRIKEFRQCSISMRDRTRLENIGRAVPMNVQFRPLRIPSDLCCLGEALCESLRASILCK